MVVFTDLDGCLLDERTYDHAPAGPALQRLRDAGVPLVLCTSKTLDEVRSLAAQLDHHGPWIVENGGAIVWRAARPGAAHVPGAPEGADGEATEVLGSPARELVQALPRLAGDVGIVVEGLSTMTVERVVELTGLDAESADRARHRAYSEPFMTTAGPPGVAALERAAAAAGLRVTRGGRFFHLTGDTDKGRAVKQVLDRVLSPARTEPSVGLGDAPNDLSMLRAVDRPIVIPRPDGFPHPQLLEAAPDAECAPLPGPAGWNAAIIAVLDGVTLPSVRSACAERGA